MAWTYEYDPATGAISGAVNNIIPITQEPSPGRALFRDPDITNTDGSVTTTAYKPGMLVDITQDPPTLIPAPPPPPPIPDVATQLLAALLNAKVIPQDSIHPETLTAINASLSAAGMATVAAPEAQGATS